MDYGRRGESATYDLSIVAGSEIGYVSKVFDIYCAAKIHPDYWLTFTEKKFFLCAYMCVKSGEKSLVSPESMEIFRTYFRHNVGKKEIHKYFEKLKKQGWLTRKNKVGVILPDIFAEITGPGDHFQFNISLKIPDETKTYQSDMGRSDEG